jgi:hypothetical protein
MGIEGSMKLGQKLILWLFAMPLVGYLALSTVGALGIFQLNRGAEEDRSAEAHFRFHCLLLGVQAPNISKY